MEQQNKTIRFYAAMLVIGGIIGVVIAIIIGVQMIMQSWPLIFLVLAVALPFVWSAYTGMHLWKGSSYGRKWATFIFSSQIPILELPGLKYEWFTGANLGPVLQLGSDASEILFRVNFGANGQFYIGGEVFKPIIGVNLFAVIAVILLVRSNISFRSNLLRESA